MSEVFFNKKWFFSPSKDLKNARPWFSCTILTTSLSDTTKVYASPSRGCCERWTLFSMSAIFQSLFLSSVEPSNNWNQYVTHFFGRSHWKFIWKCLIERQKTVNLRTRYLVFSDHGRPNIAYASILLGCLLPSINEIPNKHFDIYKSLSQSWKFRIIVTKSSTTILWLNKSQLSYEFIWYIFRFELYILPKLLWG